VAALLALAISVGGGGCGSEQASAPPSGARASPASPATSPASVGSPRPTAVTAQPTAIRGSTLAGHGELAFIAGGRLFLLGGGAGALRQVALPGLPSAPAWSADHRWLAVEVSEPPPVSNPDLQTPTALWLVNPAGAGARRLTPRSWEVTSFAWSPRADRLAAGIYLPGAKPGRSYAVATITLAGRRKILAAGGYVSGVAWSPGGGQIAAGVSVYAPRRRWRGTLELLNPAGGPPQVVRASKGDVLELAGWWPDGSGLLYWPDVQGSASIAADGLPLDSLTLASGQSRQLAFMLVHSSWLAFSPGGHAVAVVSGGYREIWGDHKQVRICRSAGGCAAVAQPAGVVSLQPSWSPDGATVVFTRASASGPFGPEGHADFSPYWISRWQATGGLGPLGALTGSAYEHTYYGYVPYPQMIAWTRARPLATVGSS
jgi:TolB protein